MHYVFAKVLPVVYLRTQIQLSNSCATFQQAADSAI